MFTNRNREIERNSFLPFKVFFPSFLTLWYPGPSGITGMWVVLIYFAHSIRENNFIKFGPKVRRYNGTDRWLKIIYLEHIYMRLGIKSNTF